MANEYLKRTPTSTGNRKVFTWAGWIKLNELPVSGTNGDRSLFSATDPVTNGDDDSIKFFRTGATGANSLYWSSSEYNVGGEETIYTNNIFRDVGSWQHVILVKDSTQTTSQDRVKIYVNGVRQQISETNAVTQNAERGINSLIEHNIGEHAGQNRHFHGEMSDVFFIDGQALTPDVFGFYKDGNGYISAGSTQATDFRPGQWVPKTPRVIKSYIERAGGFGVNGFYLPMNDSSNFGADFHTTPNSIITLKGENLPQPKNGAPTTTDNYISQLRTDPYAANLVLAVPGILGAPGVAYTDFSANIKGSGTNKVLTAVGNAGVAVTASYYGSALSFDGTGDYFTSPANDSDFQFGSGDFTIECWVKANTVSANGGFVSIWNNTDNRRSWLLYHNSIASYNFLLSSNGSSSDLGLSGFIISNTNEWNHIVGEREGSIARLYVNGVVVGIRTDLGSTSLYTNTDDTLAIGTWNNINDADNTFDGYIQDLRVYKGVAKYKGGFDVPKPYTPVGIGTWRAVPDTTANNFATLNAVDARSNSATFADGNLSFTAGTVNQSRGASTIGVSTGKYYFEARLNTVGGTYPAVGVCGIVTSIHDTFVGQDAGSFGYYSNGGVNGTGGNGGTYSTYTTGDIIGVAINLTDSQLTFYKNGSNAVTSGTVYEPLTSGNGYRAAVSCFNSGKWNTNFGQNPTFSGNITAGLSTFTDGNGKGLFRYEPPSGFLALCEDNLPTPAIKNPGEYFKTVLWTGDGNDGRSITGIGFTPDLVWMKSRNVGYSHHITDSVRGPTLALRSNGTNGDGWSTGEPGDLLSFDSDGFSIRQGFYDYNESGSTYAAWCWRAGAGTTSTNTDGSINSVVSVNQDAGFSIVSYTGTGSAGTVGHGLGKNPGMIIIKSRDSADAWVVWHKSLSSATDNLLQLEKTVGVATISNYWNSSAPNTTTFGLAGGSYAHNLSGDGMIAYCWTEIEGFSKFGSYVGNGNADGPFVYTGSRPAFIMTKRIDGVSNWNIIDTSRISSNPNDTFLIANGSNTEFSGHPVDILSNGFKIRNTEGGFNTSGGTYIFAAFAESPFTTANAK